MGRIHVLHENPDWLPPLAAALDATGAPWTDWFLDAGEVDLTAPPPAGVFYNRMSASSYDRDHRYAPELTAAVLAWLAGHGRRVVNGPAALDLEISKARQIAALSAAGVAVPRTVAVVGRDRLVAAARRAFGDGPFVLKPNRGGKGLGVRLFADAGELEAALAAGLPEPVDGTHILQARIDGEPPVVTRAEFVGGRFVYAVEIDTQGSVELCPADVCAVGEGAPAPRFRVIEGIDGELRDGLERFLLANGIEIAGIEYLRDRTGRPLVYDVNTNTNYNAEAEAAAGVSGMRAIARFLEDELRQATRRAA